MKNSIKSQFVAILFLLISLLVQLSTNFTRNIRSFNLSTFLSLIVIFVLIGATIYYILMSEKRKTSILISISAFCSGILLTVFTTKPLIWKMFTHALSSGKLLDQGFGIPIGYVFGIGMCVATAIILIALLASLIREASHMKSSKANKDYMSGTCYNYTPKYQALSVSTHIQFDKEKKSATLHQRSTVSASHIKFIPIPLVNYDYKPSKLVYTGATVGGITTGGFHTIEAHYREKSTGNSGRCLLLSANMKEEITVKEIILDSILVESASKDPNICKFLKGNKLVLKYDGSDTKLTEEERYVLKEAVNTNNVALQNYITQRAFLASSLTKEDCINIKNWISGV